MVYFFWPETARLSLEEVAKNFGDEVAVHIHDAPEEDRRYLDKVLMATDATATEAELIELSRRNK